MDSTLLFASKMTTIEWPKKGFIFEDGQ